MWASWDPQAPDFLTYLGDAVDHLDQVVDCRDGRPGGAEVIGVHKWVFPSNWKFAAENFLGDTYHNPSHRSVDMIGMGPSGQRGQSSRRDNEYAGGQRFWVGFPQGHGMTSALDAGTDRVPLHATSNTRSWTNISATASTSANAGSATRRDCCRLSARSFPNASYHGRQPRGICVWHPHSPTETEGWRFFLVDADAPAEVKDVLRRYYMRYSGSGGHDRAGRHGELAVRDRCASKGTIARRYPFNYQMSMGAYKTNDPVPGDVSTQITDQTPRNYYRVYASLSERRRRGMSCWAGRQVRAAAE